VTISALPDASAAVIASITAASPDGSATPVQPALEGTLQYAVDWSTANPTHETAVILVTDGEPTGCTYNSITGAATAAAAAAALDPPVLTHVIGIGSETAAYDELAVGGGTDEAHVVPISSDMETPILAALEEIAPPVPCDLLLPDLGEEILVPDEVNVVLTDSVDPDVEITVPFVGSADSCDSELGGWYYRFDDALEIDAISLCPTTCDQARSDDWNVSVEIGCDTV
jgi:hypothetical protein